MVEVSYIPSQALWAPHKMATEAHHKMAPRTQSPAPRIPHDTNRCGRGSYLIGKKLQNWTKEVEMIEQGVEKELEKLSVKDI